MPRKNLALLLIFALIIGPVAAFTSHLFLNSLTFVTQIRETYPHLIWTLPLTGLSMTLIYRVFPPKLNWGVSQMLLELRNPKERANPFLSLWIFITSLLSHLGGASVGREGVGLVINGSLLDGINPFPENSKERTILLQAALSAGFTGMFGTPLAGIFFVFEINEFKFGTSPLRWLTVFLAVVSTYIMSGYLGTPHTHYTEYTSASWSGIALLFLAVPVAAYAFYYAYRLFHQYAKRLGTFQLTWGGVLIAVTVYLLGNRYAGLGADVISEVVEGGSVYHWDWILKLLLTALSIGIGFKGGEVTPLFFIGATLGGSIGLLTGDTELAKLSMVAVLGSLTHTPIAAGLLAFELFGLSALPWAALLSIWGKFLLRGCHLYRFS